jgi:hypothetical protein
MAVQILVVSPLCRNALSVQLTVMAPSLLLEFGAQPTVFCAGRVKKFQNPL